MIYDQKKLAGKKPDAIKGKRILIDGELRPATILIENEKVVAIESMDQDFNDREILDAGNDPVLPGLIDAHVHLNEPGNTEWEGFESGTRAAAAGGFTTLFDMPLNSVPVTTDLAGLNAKKNAAEGKLTVDTALYGGYFDGNDQGLNELLEAGIRNIKVFLIDSGLPEFPMATVAGLRRVAPMLKEADATLIVHAELEEGRSQKQRDSGKRAGNLDEWEQSRPPAMETFAIKAMIDFCRESGVRVHIVHVATKEALPLIRAAKDEGLPITAETCPHYILYNNFDKELLGIMRKDPGHFLNSSKAKCAPPLRLNEGDGVGENGLLEALKGGTLDLIASDHSPSPPEMKQPHRSFPESWGGVASLQFNFQAMHSLTWSRDSSSLLDLCRWMSEKPAEIFCRNVRKGKIQKGYDADLIVIKEIAERKIHQKEFCRHGSLSPFADEPFNATVLTTILRGRVIYERRSFDDHCFSETRTGQIIN